MMCWKRPTNLKGSWCIHHLLTKRYEVCLYIIPQMRTWKLKTKKHHVSENLRFSINGRNLCFSKWLLESTTFRSLHLGAGLPWSHAFGERPTKSTANVRASLWNGRAAAKATTVVMVRNCIVELDRRWIRGIFVKGSLGVGPPPSCELLERNGSGYERRCRLAKKTE